MEFENSPYSHEVEEMDVLLDSGVTGLFIDHAWLHQKKITTCKLEHPIEVYNIDRSVNRGGSIMEEVTVEVAHTCTDESTSVLTITYLVR